MEGDENIVHEDVDIMFEKAKRLLFGMSTACEKCGHADDGVDGYEYPKSRKRVMLCRQHAEQEGFCHGCHERHKDIAAHMATCRMVAYAKDDERHEAALDWVNTFAVDLKAGARAGNPLDIAVIEAYKAYVKDDLYPDEWLECLEAAITACSRE